MILVCVSIKGSLCYTNGSKSVILNFWRNPLNKVREKDLAGCKSEGVDISHSCKKERKIHCRKRPGLPLSQPACFPISPGVTQERCTQFPDTAWTACLAPTCQAKPSRQMSCVHGTSQSRRGISLVPVMIDKRRNKKIGAEKLCAVTFPFVRNVKPIPNSSL